MPLLPRRLYTQLILLVSCILLATGSTSGWLTAKREVAILEASMYRSAASMTIHLADRCAYYLVLGDYAGLESFLMQSAELSDLAELQVSELNGFVIGNIEISPNGKPHRGHGVERLTPPGSFTAATGVEGETLTIWQPIAAGSPLGWLKATYDLSPIHAAQTKTWREALWFSLFWVSCSAGLLLLVLRPLVRSIKGLTVFAQRLNEHKGQQIIIEHGSQEIVDLAESLNNASQQLYTSEKQMLLDQQQLRKGKEEYRELIEKIQAAVVVHGGDTRIIMSNRQAQQLLGLTTEQMLGKTAHDPHWHFCREDGAVMLLEEYPVNRVLASGQPIRDVVLGIHRPASDDDVWALVNADPVLNDQGQTVQVIVTFIDITERKRAEEKMLRADQRLRLHRELSPLGFLEWDEHFHAIEWNAACERIFGFTREEAIGRHAKDLIMPLELHPLLDNIYQQLMSQTGGAHSINENTTKDGRIIICEWFHTTLVDKDGKAIGVASICTDITEQKRMEAELHNYREHLEEQVKKRTAELEEKNKELSRFNQLFVGRELKMIELKNRIKELEKKVEDF